jgi:hypothetical protein
MGFRPDEIVAQNPASVLHGYGEPRRDEQQLFVVKVAAGGGTSTAPFLLVALSSLVANTGPAREVGVAKVDPQTARRLEGSTRLFKELH